MLSCDEPGEDRQSASVEEQIVISPAKFDPPHLDDPQTASLRSEFAGRLLERDHAMSNGVQLQIGGVGRAVIQHQDGALLGREKLLESENLTPIAKGTLGQKAHLREAIENHARRTKIVHPFHHLASRLAKLDF